MAETSTVASNEGSLEGIMSIALKKFQQDLQIMLPCMVTSVDRQSNKVNVIPLIEVVLTGGKTQARNEVFNIPIANFSTKEFIINFPIKVGDYGYIKTCDRDISLFKQSFNQTKPNTLRKNSFSDGVFYPDTINPTNWTIEDEDLENLVIQYKDGTTKISMSENKIKMKSLDIEQESTNHLIKTDNLLVQYKDGTTKIALSGNKFTLTEDTIEQISNNSKLETNTYEIDANSTTTTGTIKNNGKSIDSTHVHSQNPDSAGNIEQNTNPPIN